MTDNEMMVVDDRLIALNAILALRVYEVSPTRRRTLHELKHVVRYVIDNWSNASVLLQIAHDEELESIAGIEEVRKIINDRTGELRKKSSKKVKKSSKDFAV